MNERIKELAEQAGATFIKGYIELSDGQLMLSDGADVDHTNMDLAKFAELFVRECARVSATKAGVYDKDAFVAKRIKEYFGVEE